MNAATSNSTTEVPFALSRFDVSGEEVKNGIKGFIFGERAYGAPAIPCT